MIAVEFVAGGVAVYLVKKRYFPNAKCKYCSKSVSQSIDLSQDSSAPSALVVREKLIELAQISREAQNSAKISQVKGENSKCDPANDCASEAPTDLSKDDDEQMEEEEIFGSGVWGVDFHSLRYSEEPVLSVALYEETIKARRFFPIVHPYMLVETPSWVYVLEKWRDGVAVSRFKQKDDAVRSRGKWFGPGRLSQRKMPHLLQSTNNPPFKTTELLVWTMDHPYFKQYTDNCHTFAANLSQKVGMKNPNGMVEELCMKSTESLLSYFVFEVFAIFTFFFL